MWLLLEMELGQVAVWLLETAHVTCVPSAAVWAKESWGSGGKMATKQDSFPKSLIQ